MHCRSRGWSISAIARHLDRDRKTIRAYLAGERAARRCAGTPAPDPLAPFVAYLAARFADDPHVWATALFDEVVPLGYGWQLCRASPGSCAWRGCARTARRARG